MTRFCQITVTSLNSKTAKYLRGNGANSVRELSKKLYRPDRSIIFSEALNFWEWSLTAMNHQHATFSCLNVWITTNEKTRDSTSYSTLLSLQGCYHESSELHLCKETSSVKELMVNYLHFKLFQKEMQRLVTPKTTHVPSSKIDHSWNTI